MGKIVSHKYNCVCEYLQIKDMSGEEQITTSQR